MLTWALEHPWMTFWLVLFALFVIGTSVENICHVINTFLTNKK